MTTQTLTKNLGIQGLSYHDFLMPGNLRFGIDTFYTLPDEIRKINGTKITVISDRGLEKVGMVDRVMKLVEPLEIETSSFTEISGEPTFTLLKQSIDHTKKVGSDLIIGIGEVVR